jgi:hypothetical protein
MLGVTLALALAACNFRLPFAGEVDANTPGEAAADTAADAPGDAAPRPLCAPDSHLPLCFTFDQSPLPAALANEGSAAVSAKLSSVSQIASPYGNAVALDATSTIALPFNGDVSGVLSIEIWFRIDSDVANGARSGLMDSNVLPPNISMFWNRTDPTHQLSCGIGNQAAVFPVTFAVGAWTYAACTCSGGIVTLYIDGLLVATAGGDCGAGGAFVADGLTIGANNTGVGQPVNDRLVGAIDGVRLWTQALSARDVCTTAGRAGC